MQFFLTAVRQCTFVATALADATYGDAAKHTSQAEGIGAYHTVKVDVGVYRIVAAKVAQEAEHAAHTAIRPFDVDRYNHQVGGSIDEESGGYFLGYNDEPR